MSDEPLYQASPALIEFIEWSRARVQDHRKACHVREWWECQLRPAYDGVFDQVTLRCEECQAEIVVLKP